MTSAGAPAAELWGLWLLGTLRLWVCFGCLPWARGVWWGWAAGGALAALAIAPDAAPVEVTLGAVAWALLAGAALGLSARALCLAGRALGGLLEAGLPGRAPLGVAAELWFGLLLVAQGGHVALMEGAAMSLRWLPVGGEGAGGVAVGARLLTGVAQGWALAVGLALPLLWAAAALEVGLGVAGRVSRLGWLGARGEPLGGARGELTRWAAAWLLIMATARALGPWWAQALADWGGAGP